MKYNWQQKDWPDFKYDLSKLEEPLFQLAEGQGQLAGLLQGMPGKMQEQSIIDVMVAEAVKTFAIESKRQVYYKALKVAQRSNEITPWINYFVYTILDAQEMVKRQISFTIAKVHFFDKYVGQLNPRQEKVLNRMLEAGPDGFEGGMRAKKYMSIAKTSKATATRDLQELVNIGALIARGGGRSIRYELKI